MAPPTEKVFSRPRPRPHGTSKHRCKFCPLRSIAGLVRGQEHCPYHWAVYAWGKAWADTLYTSAQEQE